MTNPSTADIARAFDEECGDTLTLRINETRIEPTRLAFMHGPFPAVITAPRASTRRFGLLSSMRLDPLTLVAVLGQRFDVLTVETAAALGVLAAQIGRAA